MKIGKLLILVLLGAMTLAACGGGGGGSQPTEVVEKVVSAMGTLDVQEARQYFCEEQKSALDETLNTGFADLEAMGLNADELLSAFKLNMKDMKYEEVSKGDDSAVVHVSGNMSVDFDTEKLKEFLKKAMEASGQEVDEQGLDFMVGMFQSMSGQEAPIDGDVKMVKENGDWLVCDELNFLESSDLFQLP
jgi:hypothetical protein